MMKEYTQPDGGLHWMMTEDQEYTEMEQGALSLVSLSTGAAFSTLARKGAAGSGDSGRGPQRGPEIDLMGLT